VNSNSRTRIDNRKQAVSLRMSRSDIRDIKRLAERLGARDSDVIRFAIKQMLLKLTLLEDPNVRGHALVPVFMELGAELVRHFDLDAARLSAIINDGVEGEQRVEPEDIRLIAMNATQRLYLQPHIPGLPPGRSFEDSAGTGSAGGPPTGNGHSLENSLRQYLYDKYLQTGTTISSHRAGG
jgi:hypothetical protein